MIHALILGIALYGAPIDIAAGQSMFADVNATRARAGLPALTQDPQLDRIAVQHAADMAEHHYFSHLSRDGQTPFDRMQNAGIPFTQAGENIAEAVDEPTAYSALLGSPEHLANILRRGFSRIGIGAVDGPNGEVFFVQDFTN